MSSYGMVKVVGRVCRSNWCQEWDVFHFFCAFRSTIDKTLYGPGKVNTKSENQKSESETKKRKVNKSYCSKWDKTLLGPGKCTSVSPGPRHKLLKSLLNISLSQQNTLGTQNLGKCTSKSPCVRCKLLNHQEYDQQLLAKIEYEQHLETLWGSWIRENSPLAPMSPDTT